MDPNIDLTWNFFWSVSLVAQSSPPSLFYNSCYEGFFFFFCLFTKRRCHTSLISCSLIASTLTNAADVNDEADSWLMLLLMFNVYHPPPCLCTLQCQETFLVTPDQINSDISPDEQKTRSDVVCGMFLDGLPRHRITVFLSWTQQNINFNVVLLNTILARK